MTQPESIQGKVTFIHHEKNYVTIDYELNGKKKSINGMVGEKEQLKWKAAKIIKKPHHFRMGDEVIFNIVLSGRGDKMIADNIVFRYNNEFTNLLQKAPIENKFVGYLKEVDDHYFVKETSSYIVFPLIISPWEIKPPDTHLNEPAFFKLDNFNNPSAVTASLIRQTFIPEYNKALQFFKNEKPVNTTVVKITVHGVVVQLFSERIQVKIGKDILGEKHASLKEGDSINVLISYISPAKIVLQLPNQHS